MTFAKSCPGSRAIRQPTPEYIDCPNCGEEVEVWTHELSYPCSKCGTRVFREQRPSCIDWCSYAKECVGADVYRRLKPEAEKDSAGAGTPLHILSQEHDKTSRQIGVLRAATLCLRAGARVSLAQSAQALEQAVSNLSQVLEFFDTELRLHFRREEEVLFPILEKHLGREGSPTPRLLAEHAELWQWHDRLKEKLAELPKEDSEHPADIASEVYDIGSHIASLLRSHIEKENKSLLPLAKDLLGEEELGEISRKWQAMGGRVS